MDTCAKDSGTAAMSQVYRATVLAALLYGAETWTVYSVQTDRLQVYVMRHQRSIIGISWRDKITNVEVLKRAGCQPLKSMLIQMNLRWPGHVEKIDHNRLPRQLLYSQLKEGRRNQGRPRLRLKDIVKRNVKKLDMDRENWQKNARNRDGLRCLIRPKWRRSLSYRQAAMMMIAILKIKAKGWIYTTHCMQVISCLRW